MIKILLLLLSLKKQKKGVNVMVGRQIKHAFARQYLEDHSLILKSSNTHVLKKCGKIYEIKLPNTRYYVGDRFTEKGETKKITSYEEVRDMGFCIISVPVPDNMRWKRSQVVMYLLCKAEETGEQLSHIPTKHWVEYDSYNRALRLWGPNSGPNGAGNWVEMEKPKQEAYNKGMVDINNYSKRASELLDKQLMEWKGEEEELEPIIIPEAPFMVTESNEIVCLPNIPDMPSILITGQKRTGKSFLLHSLVSRLFWKPEFDYKIAILNDSSRETAPWCLPNSDLEQIRILSRLNEHPLPLPCVFFHPKVKEDYEKLFMGTPNYVGFDITIPFKEIIENHKKYLNLKGSSIYFTRIKKLIMRATTEKKVLEILDRMTDEFKIPANTANKIRAAFDTLFESKMTDISTEEQQPWSFADGVEYYNPITACMHAGVLPVLETEYISSRPELLSIYFTYFVNDLFIRQKQDTKFIRERSQLFLVIDECHNISGTSATRNSGADLLLRRCVREGGPRRIGTLLATQKFGELPDVIKDNTTYLICFKNPGEASKIANQYNLGSHVASQIKDLGKHQCMAYTSEYFIVYDVDGNKRKSKLNEVFVGKSLPPFSQHKKPMER